MGTNELNEILDSKTIQARKLGYELLETPNGSLAVRPLDRESYTPEIHFYDGEWQIQTTAYGTKTPDEIDDLIDGYRKAQKMVLLLDLM